MKYTVPEFLHPGPDAGDPTLASPTSQLCTAEQFDEPDFRRIAAALTIDPVVHRKNWEWVYIVRVLEHYHLIRPNLRGLGFGCGTEKIPGYLASHGMFITATDAPPEVGEAWAPSGQYLRPEAHERVTYGIADMRAIPEHLNGFDFLWSSCALEHLGGLQPGLDFIVNAMRCLKPGGLAIHTTEFNLVSNDETFESPGLSVYRRRDIEAVADQLRAAGHEVAEINFFPGSGNLDTHIDLPPYSIPHIKLLMMAHTFTSIGLIVRKKRGFIRRFLQRKYN